MLHPAVERWLDMLAAWKPPGVVGTTTCKSCARSRVRNVGAIGVMPHDLVHALVCELEPHITALFHQLCDKEESEQWAGNQILESNTPLSRSESARLWRLAEIQVVAEISALSADIDRLWEVHAEPRLQAYTRYWMDEILEP